MTYCTQDIRWRARKNGGHPGMVYFVLRVSPLSLTQQSILQYSVTCECGTLQRDAVHCVEGLCVHQSRKEMGERTASPLSVTEDLSSIPFYLAGWCSVITSLSQPCHHKHRHMEKETELMPPSMLGCQYTRLMQRLLRRSKQFVPTSQTPKLKWHLCPRRGGAENWYTRIFLWPEWSNCCRVSTGCSVSSPWEL